MKKTEFQELLHSIDQARAIHRGERKPSRVFHYEPVKVRAIRRKLKLTQHKFAALLCVSLGTLRNWEQGRTAPEGAAIALLRVTEARPEAVLEALHAN
ncbi:MAG: NadS family protein [Candidatus Omnitrophota bacterium]